MPIFSVQYNDVAMLTLDRPAEYSEEVRPVCLDGSGKKYAGDDVIVAGWGSMFEGKCVCVLV